MTCYVLALSTDHAPAASVLDAERLMGNLVAAHVADGYAPPDRIDVGLNSAGTYIAYASMVKEVDPVPSDPVMAAALDAHAGERPLANNLTTTNQENNQP